MALTDVQKNKIHEVIYNSGKQYIPVQELTHAANEIIKDPTEETVQAMLTYLDNFPYQRHGQPSFLPTTQTRGLAGNDIRLGMSEVRKILEESANQEEDDEEEG